MVLVALQKHSASLALFNERPVIARAFKIVNQAQGAFLKYINRSNANNQFNLTPCHVAAAGQAATFEFCVFIEPNLIGPGSG